MAGGVKKRVRRLTLKPKTHKQPDVEHDTDSKPSKQEFEAWEEYGTLVAPPGKGDLKISKDDCILILPPGPEPRYLYNYWIAKVRSIRGKDSKLENIWIQVQWFYNTHDVARDVKSASASLKATSCDPFELIFSDHTDFIPASTVNGVTSVTRYVETSLTPPVIPLESFWTRYDYEPVSKKVMPHPAPVACAPGMCGAYDPHEEMRLCPQQGCMRWFHTGCLVDDSEGDEEEILGAKRIMASQALIPIITISQTSVRKPKPKGATTEGDSDDIMKSISDAMASVPPEVVRIASQPIVRGGTFGITGNIERVCSARRTILQAMVDNETNGGGIEKSLKRKREGGGSGRPGRNGLGGKDDSVDSETPEETIPYLCPMCNGSI